MIITAYRKDDGRAVEVPEHWIGHPTLGKAFTTTPPATGTTKPEETTTTTPGHRAQKEH